MVGESTFRKYIWVALAFFLGVTVFLGYQVTKVGFDYNFEKFFPSNDEETDFFMSYRDKYKSDNDFLLIAIERDAGIFDSLFLSKVNEYTIDLEKAEDVTFVNSITNLEEYYIFPGGMTSSRKYVDLDEFDKDSDSVRIFKNVELINTIVSDNGKSVCIFVRHEDYLSKKRSDRLIKNVKHLVAKYDFENVRIAGRTIGQKYYIDKMTYEMILFVGLSAFLIIVFLLLAFRSGWGILIPQIVVFSSMIWIVGIMGAFNEPINIILSILPSIMFVVSMSDVIHLVSRYLDALRTEKSTYAAIVIAVKEVGLATLLTSVTTSIGFFSLYFVSIQPIQAFGIVMGVGVLLAFFLTFLTLPVLFYLFPGPKYVRKGSKEHFWKRFLERCFIWVLKKRKKVLVISGVVVGLSIIGMFQIKTNNYLMDDLLPKEKLKLDFNFLDEHYGGVRPFELSVSLKDTNINVWDKSVLQTLDTVEQYLEKTYKVSVKNSLVKTLKVMNRSSHAGVKDYFVLPSSTKKIRSFRKSLRIVNKGDFIKTMMDSTENFTRISGVVPDLGNTVISKKNRGLDKFLRSHDLDGTIEFQLTGTAHLIDKNMEYLSTSLIKGLGISILIVALIIGLIYRSARIVVISIVANIIPLLFIAGIMGFFGIDLKTSTSIIFTIAFGIAVDDTIHFLGKFKHELLKGRGKIYALKRSYMTTGKAMILTTLILCSGFFLLVFSGFMGTFYMGVLLCITLFVALIADITLLPVLLLLFYTPRAKVSKD